MAGEWLPLAIVWSGLYQHKQRHFPRWCNSVTTSTGLCPQTTFILIYLSWSVCSGSVSSVSSILDDETGTLGGRCFIAEYHRPCSSIGRAAIFEIYLGSIPTIAYASSNHVMVNHFGHPTRSTMSIYLGWGPTKSVHFCPSNLFLNQTKGLLKPL